MNPLRRLDDRFVPAIAAFFDQLIPPAPEPTGPAPLVLRLRRVDDRWTQRGPLALIREVPQLGGLAIAAIVLASGVTVASRDVAQERARGGPESQQASGSDERLTIGPQIDDSVPAYVEAAHARLRETVAGSPDAPGVAVVSFAQYRTMRQVQELVGGAGIVRVWYRVPLPLTQTQPREVIAVKDFFGDTRREFDRIARLIDREVGALQSVIDTNDHDAVQRKADEEQRDIYKREAAELRGDCACIYAVVVETRMRFLGDLPAKPGIRLVDVSEPNRFVLDFVDFTSLLPEEVVKVTGGNQA